MTPPKNNMKNKIGFVVIKYAFEVSPTIKDMVSFFSDNGYKVDIITDKLYRDEKFTMDGVDVIVMEALKGKDVSFYRDLLKGYQYIFAVDYLALTFLSSIDISLSNVVYLSLELNQYMLKEPKQVPLNMLNKCRLGIIQSKERHDDFKKYFDEKLSLEFEYLPVSIRPVSVNAVKDNAGIIYSGYLSEWSGMLEFIKLFSGSRYRSFFELIIQGHAMGTEYYVQALKNESSKAGNILIDEKYYTDAEHINLLSRQNIGIAVYKSSDESPNWDNLLFSSGKIAAYLWTGCAVITNIKHEITSRAPFIYIKDLSDIDSLEKGFENYLGNMEMYYSNALKLAEQYYNLDYYANNILKRITGVGKDQGSVASRKKEELTSETKNMNKNIVKLHLGCGEKYLQGYVNIDYPSDEHNVMNVRPDIACDLMELSVPDATVDEIRLHHVFEHFNRVTALALLIRWYSWLKPGGLLHIETPDLIGSAKTLLSDESFKVKMGVVRHLAGDQAASWAYHVDQWFPERFETTLSKLGFGNISIETSSWPKEPYLSNVDVKAVKTTSLSVQELVQRADELLWDSTVSPKEERTYNVWRDQLRKVLRGEDIYDNQKKSSDKEIPGAVTIKLPAVDKAPYSVNAYDFNQRERDNWVIQKAQTVPAGATVLDIGAGTCPYKSLFAHCNYIAHDFKKYEGVKLGNTQEYGKIDVESDIVNIPLQDGFADIILCTEVLEHVPEPIKALQEMARLLKPGGKMFITAPLGSGLHQLPYHYYGGYTPEWYRHFGEKFGLDINEIIPNGGFFKLMSQEASRIKSVLAQHPELTGGYADSFKYLFGEWMPKYLYEIENKCFVDQFTVGYHVEYVKQPADKRVTINGSDKLQKEKSGSNIAGIVFSKNRAMQLDAVLKSFYLNCADANDIKLNILYTASGKHVSQYAALKSHYKNADFIEEINFKQQLTDVAAGSDFVLFLVDDNIFVNEFSIKDVCRCLHQEEKAIGFSLRLGKNTTYCYPKNMPQELPSFIEFDKNILIYNWTNAQLDFNYPLEVSSSVFRTKEILPVLLKADYRNPNTLEGVFAEVKNYYSSNRPLLFCFESSVAFCAPVNKVQQEIPNRAGDQSGYNTETLSDLFESGRRVDITGLKGFIPGACHQEIKLNFTGEPVQHSKKPEVLITVYTAAYNAEKYISGAISSVLDQSFTDFEYIIVDDGSTDRTADIIQKYKDSRIKFYKREHKNFAAAMNYAISQASGKYIVGVDADDFISSEYLADMYNAALKYPDADYIYPEEFTIIDSNSNLTGNSARFEDFSGDKNKLLLQKLFFEATGRVPNPGSLKKRSIYSKLGLYEEVDTIEDFVFLCNNAIHIQFRLAQGAKGYFYRESTNSNSKKFTIRGEIMANAIFNMATKYSPTMFFPDLESLSAPALTVEFLSRLYKVFKRHSEYYSGRGGEHFALYAAKISEIITAREPFKEAV